MPCTVIDQLLNIGFISGWLVIVGALGIIFIGVGEFLYPAVGALGFGLPRLLPAMPIH
jgi:hypothetical protein